MPEDETAQEPEKETPEENVARRAYEQKFKELMKKQPPSADERIRHLLFAVADPDCPLAYYHRFGKLSESSVAELIEMVTGSGNPKSGVRAALYRHSALLGLLNDSKEKTLQVLLPNEYEEINSIRSSLELTGLELIHGMAEGKSKTNVIEDLIRCNVRIAAILDPRQLFSDAIIGEEDKESLPEQQPERQEALIDLLARKLKTEPKVGLLAEQFSLLDFEFHAFPASVTNSQVRRHLIEILLQRIRLNRPSRATIIRRIPIVYEHHKLIVAAVRNGSKKDIKRALNEHLKSAKEDFEETQ